MPIQERLGILCFGLGSSALTVLVNVLCSKLIGLSLFTFALWFIVPVGAIGMGFLAAGGFYLGALYFNRKLQKFDLILMAILAAITMYFIYYAEYSSLVLDNGIKVSDAIPFSQYLDVILTKSHYRVGRGAGVDTGEVGQFGYWLALLQFIGFMLGGVAVYFILKIKLMCAECQKYYRVLKKKALSFTNPDEFSPFWQELQASAPGDAGYLPLVQRDAPEPKKVEKGAVMLELSLYGCPQCKQQYVEELTKVFNGSEWKEVPEAIRKILVPKEMSLDSVFNK